VLPFPNCSPPLVVISTDLHGPACSRPGLASSQVGVRPAATKTAFTQHHHAWRFHVWPSRTASCRKARRPVQPRAIVQQCVLVRIRAGTACFDSARESGGGGSAKMSDFQTSTHRERWIFQPQNLVTLPDPLFLFLCSVPQGCFALGRLTYSLLTMTMVC
jgi:hypothetical protein